MEKLIKYILAGLIFFIPLSMLQDILFGWGFGNWQWWVLYLPFSVLLWNVMVILLGVTAESQPSTGSGLKEEKQ